MRIRCNTCSRKARVVGVEAARGAGWLVGATAMCPTCAGPKVCSTPPGANWRCEDCNCHRAGHGELQVCEDGPDVGTLRWKCVECGTTGDPQADGYAARLALSKHNAVVHGL